MKPEEKQTSTSSSNLFSPVTQNNAFNASLSSQEKTPLSRILNNSSSTPSPSLNTQNLNQNNNIVQTPRPTVNEIKAMFHQTPNASTAKPSGPPSSSYDNSSSNDVASVASTNYSFKQLPTASVVVDDNSAQNKIKKKKKVGLIGRVTGWMKLMCLLLVIILFASIFVNVYQAIAGDCRDLEEQLKRLEGINDDLESVTNELEQSKRELQKQIDDYRIGNDQLNQTVISLKESNKELNETVVFLRFLSDRVDSVFKHQNQSFSEFEKQMNELLLDMEAQQMNLSRYITNFTTQITTAELNLEDLKQTRILTEQNYLNALSIYNDSLMYGREQLSVDVASYTVSCITPSTSLQNDHEVYSLDEFTVLISRLIDIYFREEDSRKPVIDDVNEFGFRESMRVEDIGSLIHSLKQKK